MRGGDEQTGELFSYVNLEKRVRKGSARPLMTSTLVVGRQSKCERGAFTPPHVLVHVQQEHLCEDFWAQHAVFQAGNSGPPVGGSSGDHVPLDLINSGYDFAVKVC